MIYTNKEVDIMLIKETCMRCKLTKKAVEYYEQKGLLTPNTLENGYRDYSDEDISILKEISVLRRCGVGITEIQDIFESGNKAMTLEKYGYLTKLSVERHAATQACVDSLIKNYDVDGAFEQLNRLSNDAITIKERLVFAFPGSYGLFLSLHFGVFLDESIDTDQKRAAYAAIIEYIDRIDLHLSPGLTQALETLAVTLSKKAALQIYSQRWPTACNTPLPSPSVIWNNTAPTSKVILPIEHRVNLSKRPPGRCKSCCWIFRKRAAIRKYLSLT